MALESNRSHHQWRKVFEDTHLLVLSKSAGLLSQGGEFPGANKAALHGGEPSNLVDELRTYFGRHYVGLVHRLDRNTSGLMVVAKRSKAADRLTQSLQSGRLVRSYLALLACPKGLVADSPKDFMEPQDWEHHLIKDESTNVVRVVAPGTSQSKKARLHVQPQAVGLFRSEPVALVELTLETGRSHQIRVQAAAEGCPLVGDLKYGASQLSPRLQKFGRPALHSATLKFPHPMSGEEVFFEDPLPADMQNFLDEIKITKAAKSKA